MKSHTTATRHQCRKSGLVSVQSRRRESATRWVHKMEELELIHHEIAPQLCAMRAALDSDFGSS